jgi:hypothetical protein
MVAIVRKVYNRNSGPHLGVLAPEVQQHKVSGQLFWIWIRIRQKILLDPNHELNHPSVRKNEVRT